MADEEDLLRALREQVRALDDGTLEAIASPGLLRRARKDMASGRARVEVREAGAEGVIVAVGGHAVTIPPEGPAKASCSCPSVSTCRHILVAILHLRESGAGEGVEALKAPAEAEERGTALDAVLAVGLDELTRWAGKRSMREAIHLLELGVEVEVSEESLKAQFPDLDVTCWFHRSSGLTGMMCSCGSPHVCGHKAAALLAVQTERGVVHDVSGLRRAKEVTDPPRMREEVVKAAQDLLEDMVRAGLSHPSEMAQQRLTTLAISAMGANLHRLSSSLRALGDEVELLLGRDARADEGRLFARAGMAYALCEAIRASLPDVPKELAGQARTRYDQVLRLELAGMGAYWWQTASGYRGLTVLFWSPEEGEWYTWTDARPEFRGPDFSPSERFRQAGPWTGVPSPEEASRSQVRLHGAKRNVGNRLSSSRGTTASVVGATSVDSLGLERVTFTRWEDLLRHAAGSRAMGLDEPDPQSALVVLRPARWGARAYDDVEQALRWQLVDEEGGALPMVVRNEPADEYRLHRLETMDPVADGVWGVVGRVQLGAEAVTVYPISMLRSGAGDAVVNLSFHIHDEAGKDAREGGTGRRAPRKGGATARARHEERDREVRLGGPLGDVLGGLVDELLLMAERGGTTVPRGGRSSLQSILPHLEGLGLDGLASLVRALLSGPEDPAPALLRARFVCQLSLEAATLPMVEAGPGGRRGGWASRLLGRDR